MLLRPIDSFLWSIVTLHLITEVRLHVFPKALARNSVINERIIAYSTGGFNYFQIHRQFMSRNPMAKIPREFPRNNGRPEFILWPNERRTRSGCRCK